MSVNFPCQIVCQEAVAVDMREYSAPHPDICGRCDHYNAPATEATS